MSIGKPKEILMRRFGIGILVLLNVMGCCRVEAGDWPMWRADAQRTASTKEQLPVDLRLLWTRRFPPRRQTWDDPLNLDLMTYDRVFEPIVMDGRLFVGFNDRDQLTAYDATTGQQLWSFFADGPVRLPPVGGNGNVYFCSDDGCLYCVAAQNGKLQWRFRGAPSEQKAIGNQRVISAWPARGGPVLRDGTVYFAASIWPMMGTFLYALNAETGTVEWVNDSTGAQFIKQPHSAPSFAGVAPQGALVATDELLIVPGGRSVPAVFGRSDGELRYFEINAGGKGTGGSFVTADDRHFYVHTRLKGTRAFDLETGIKTAFMPNEPVLADGIVYSAESNGQLPVVRAYGPEQEVLWELEADGRGDLILAGDSLYAAGEGTITSIRLPANGRSAERITQLSVTGQVERLIAADGKLFAVTLEGSLMAFGAGSPGIPESMDREPEEFTSLAASPEPSQVISNLLSDVDGEGYAFWFGVSDASLIEALAARSSFAQLTVIDDDVATISRLRSRLDAAGLYGRVTAHHSEARSFQAPRYVAHAIFVGREWATSASTDVLTKLYESVRPYGGVMHLLAGERRDEIARAVTALNLEQAEVSITEESVSVRRVGPLPGSADWTHQYGDVANTIKSNDSRVKLPLGVLWFGGSSHVDVLPRHGHGPPEQVVGGRMFVQGMNSLSARDVYTGRVLWQREFEDLGTFDVFYDDTYEDTPLNPQYNQVHIPGANGRGTNYVVTQDRVYILEGSVCHVLDPATGETLQDIELPPEPSGGQRQWGYIGIYEDLLLAGLGFAMYRDRHGLVIESDAELKKNRAGFGSKSLDRAASLGLVAFDRQTGQPLWRVDAKQSFWHNGIVAGGGRIYCLDRQPELIENALKRRGISQPETYRIAAFDAQTGALDWEVTEGIFGTWLGYSQAHDLLLQAGAAASDRLYAEIGQGMAVYRGRDGALRWKKDTLKYAGPCILHNEWIITNANSYTESAGAFHIQDGRQKMIDNPITGEIQPWKMTRAYGCNNIIASENLLTFRSGAAGFYDLFSESGTGNFGGFKSGCTSNLVVANGVLNAPDYTRTCSCAYQNQTSLALVHMPELEFWTINPAASVESTSSQIERVGINFGAPGDRRDADGLLWLEYPVLAGPSPNLSVKFNEEARFVQHHSSTIAPREHAWVFASGAENVTEVTVGLTLQTDVNLASGVPVSHPDDDAEEQETGEVSLDSSDLELVEDSGNQLVGLRFNHINLAQGAEIRSASLQFTCDEPSGNPTSLIIAAQDAGHAERFAGDSHDISSRPRTAAEVAWRPEPWRRSGAAEDAERTPDLAPLLRSVIHRPDWKPGNSLAFFISGVGKRTAAASRGEGSGAARLIVDADEANDHAATQRSDRRYRVRLFFAAPRNPKSGVRRFDVVLQGQTVLEDVTIDPAGPVQSQFIVQTVENVSIADELQIQLIPRQGTPVLSGIDLQHTGPR